MCITFNVGIKFPGLPSYFNCNPAQAICSNLVLSKMSGAFSAVGTMLGKEMPLSQSVVRTRDTRTCLVCAPSSFTQAIIEFLLSLSGVMEDYMEGGMGYQCLVDGEELALWFAVVYNLLLINADAQTAIS